MAFAHQYTHTGPAAPGSQVMLSTKSSHSPTSPSDRTRTLIHESGLPLLHFLPRMNGLPEMYGQGHITPNGLGVEPSAFFPMGGPPGHLPGTPEQWKGLAGQPPVVYPFDPMLAVHPYASFYGGLDLNNAARRKNATRETTSALKAWLYEHRKNPYPTKGEKIMLAIITKMTLTQVSTWFANARRRLKKESKSGWNGKDRDLDDSDFETDVDDRPNENKDKSNFASISCSGIESDDEDIDIKVTSDLSDISDAETDQQEVTSNGSGSRLSINSESSSNSTNHNCESRQISSSPVAKEHSNGNEVQRNSVVVSPNTKPKIWSIVEIMNKDTPKTKTTNSNQTYHFREAEEKEYTHQPEEQSCSLEHSHNQIQNVYTNGLHNSQSNKTVLKSRTETIVSPRDNKNVS